VTQSLAQLEGRQLQLEQELTTLRSTFGENWPAVVEKRNEIKLVREQLTREKTAILASHQEQTRLDLQGAEARRNMALGALNEQKTLVNRFHDASIQYNILKREVDTNRNLYDGLLERLRQTGVMAGFQFGNLQVVEPGRPSNFVDTPKVWWNLAIAVLLGLALGVCLVILLDFWDNSISTLEEAEQLALPSLGSVPLMKTFKSSGLLAYSDGNGHTNGNGKGKASVPVLAQRITPAVFPGKVSTLPFEVTESMRAICASILLSRSDHRPRVIVVTSATHAEGKTTLVTHLGRAFAEAGHSTLLVEADMRKPDLSRAFSIGNEDGLSLYLAGHVSPWPKVHETETPNLFVAAAGPMPPNPAALLHSDKLKLFLKAAASDYQVVIVDAPPLLSIADARILGLAADGVVLVVRAGKTGKNLVRRACALLETSGANVLGMVLNGWAPSAAELSHYRYHHHHHHHGQNAHSA
jgi:capsular exopolysaccharide synthesis family protein